MPKILHLWSQSSGLSPVWSQSNGLSPVWSQSSGLNPVWSQSFVVSIPCGLSPVVSVEGSQYLMVSITCRPLQIPVTLIVYPHVIEEEHLVKVIN